MRANKNCPRPRASEKFSEALVHSPSPPRPTLPFSPVSSPPLPLPPFPYPAVLSLSLPFLLPLPSPRLPSFPLPFLPFPLPLPFFAARGSGGALKLPQRVRAEPGRQTFSGAFRAENPASGELLS